MEEGMIKYLNKGRVPFKRPSCLHFGQPRIYSALLVGVLIII
jgi:hypothetical protein